jgi:hypothetical protein
MQVTRKRFPGELLVLLYTLLTCVLRAGTNELLETSYFSCRKPSRHEVQGTNSIMMDMFSRGGFYLVRDKSWNLLALACVACGLSGPCWLSLGAGISPAFPVLCKPADDDNAFFILPLPGTVVHGRIGARRPASMGIFQHHCPDRRGFGLRLHPHRIAGVSQEHFGE